MAFAPPNFQFKPNPQQGGMGGMGGQQMTQAEAMLENTARNTCMKLAPLEKEWNVEKLRSKLFEYLRKAAKSIQGTSRGWEAVVEDFAYKFVQSFWTALGDRDYLDKVDTTDFANCVITAIPSYSVEYFPMPELNAVVSTPEYTQKCVNVTEAAFDCARYNAYGWQVFKSIIPTKTAQKKVRDAVDAAREEVLQQRADSAETYLQQWIKLSTDNLAKTGVNNLHHNLPQDQALKLFNELVQEGGGIPTYLIRLNGGKPPSDWGEIENAVNIIYGGYPPPKVAPAGTKGKFGGKGDGWGGKGGGDSWGKGGDSWGWDGDMMSMMMAMMGKGDSWGGGGKGGKGGWSPY